MKTGVSMHPWSVAITPARASEALSVCSTLKFISQIIRKITWKNSFFQACENKTAIPGILQQNKSGVCFVKMRLPRLP
jgi:hypothetical protein